MSKLELYRDDLLTRYPGHSFVETPTGSMTQVEFQTGGAVTIAEATTLVDTDAYINIREQLVGTSADVTLTITGAQQDALTLDDEFIIIVDGHVACYDGNEIAVVGATGWQVRPDTIVQTDNDTPTEIDEFDLDDDEVYMVQINVVGITDDATERCGVIKSAVAYRSGGGGATIQGNVALTLEEYSDSNWDVDITVSGNAVRATVTGVSATTIDWHCSMQFIEQ